MIGAPKNLQGSAVAEKPVQPALSCGVVSMILHLAVSVEHRLVTDRQTDRHTTTANTAPAWGRAVKIRTTLET